jgi:hypothetical protein
MTVKEICHDSGIQDLVQQHKKLSEVYMCLLPDAYLDDEMQSFKNHLAATLASLGCSLDDKIKDLLKGG